MCSLRCFVFGSIWFLLLSPLVVLFVILGINRCVWYHAVVFDVGSTGTRGTAYTTKQSLHPVWEAKDTVKCEDGAGPGNGFSEKLQTLDDKAIKDHYRKCFTKFVTNGAFTEKVRFFFKATAGMRNFCYMENAKCQKGFQLIREVAKELGFIFGPVDVGLLSGQDEGGFQFAYVNEYPPSSYQAKFIATLDLGGESIEMAVPRLTHLAERINLLDYNLFLYKDKFYRLDAKYSDCYGEKPARYMMQVTMLNKARGTTSGASRITDNCLPTGISVSFQQTAVSSHCNVPNVNGETQGVTFVGDFNFDKCITSMIENLFDCADCLKKTVNFENINPEIRIMGMGSFPKSLSDLNLSGISNYGQFAAATNTFCGSEDNSEAIQQKQKSFCWLIMYQNALVKWLKIEKQIDLINDDKKRGWSNGFIENSLYYSYNCWIFFYNLNGFGLVLIIYTLALIISYCKRRNSARWTM